MSSSPYLNDARNLGLGLIEAGFGPFFGVPDSSLQVILDLVQRHAEELVYTAAHESQAFAEAIGFSLGCSRYPVVYLQNSGLGNLINPITSLASVDTFDLPMLFLIGWRGSPGAVDEPQHLEMGKKTEGMLELLGIPSLILSEQNAKEIVAQAIKYRKHRRKLAILIPHSLFRGIEQKKQEEPHPLALHRAAALRSITSQLAAETFFISTTGFTSRELCALRLADGSERAGTKSRDLRIVGGMGLALSVGLGLAKAYPEKCICVLDGDGAALMHLGGMATVGAQGTPALLHIIFNNGVHESTGWQNLSNSSVDFCGVASACGYAHVRRVTALETLKLALLEFENRKNLVASPKGPFFIEVMVSPGTEGKLNRPKESPAQNLQLFAEAIRSRYC